MLSLWSLHVHFTANGSHRTQAVQESEDDVHQGGEYCFEFLQLLFFLPLIIKIIIISYRYNMIIIVIWWYLIVSALIIKPHRPFLIFDDICEVHRKVGESSRGWKIEFRLNQQWIENYRNSLGTKTQCKNCESCLFPSYCQTGSNVCPFCPVYRVAQIVGSWDPQAEKVVL